MINCVIKAQDAIKNKMPIDVVTINITDILEEIGKITGESVSAGADSACFDSFLHAIIVNIIMTARKKRNICFFRILFMLLF